MKTISNKTTELTAASGEGKATYAELIKICLDNPPKEGFDLKSLRDRNRIEDALTKANGTIKLEDADAENLKPIVESMRWGARHKDIMLFCEEVKNM
jgi:hypothetical protein